MCDLNTALQQLQPTLSSLPRQSLRSRRACAVRAESRQNEHRIPDVALPNGVWWLDKSTHSHDIIYGGNFVVQRPKLGGEGLIPYPALTGIQLMPDVPSSRHSRPAPHLLPAGTESYFDVLEYTLEEDQKFPGYLQLPAPAEPQVAGLVLWQQPDGDLPVRTPFAAAFTEFHASCCSASGF